MTDSSFSRIINSLKQNDNNYCILEHRPKKFMFGCNNYGDIPGTLNPADGDPWDVIVAGYEPLPMHIKYKIKSFDGIIVMPHGNHKLVVDIETPFQRKPFSDVRNEVFTYRRLYNKICKKRGEVILF